MCCLSLTLSIRYAATAYLPFYLFLMLSLRDCSDFFDTTFHEVHVVPGLGVAAFMVLNEYCSALHACHLGLLTCESGLIFACTASAALTSECVSCSVSGG